MNKSALIFDHDGTLVDSIDAVVLCTNEVIKASGFPSLTRKEVKEGMAYPTMERFEYHTGIKDLYILSKMMQDFYKLMHDEGIKHIKLYKGVKESLDLLAGKGFALGLVSNNQGLFVRKAAALLGYAYDFEVMLGEENVPYPKPHPAGLLQACAGMGVDVGNCWYIGDGKPDFEAAKAAGMKSALVSWGAHRREELEKCNADITV